MPHLSTAPSSESLAAPVTIGVFDSGVGGISVLQHIRRLLPDVQLVYVADSQYAPYGGRSAQQIRERSHGLVEFLLSQQAKAVVVACNTATAAAVASLREHYALPVIGMEPAVKPAVAATRTGVVGVMATVGTLQSARFAALLDSYGQGVQVVTQGCSGLVEQVEKGELHTAQTRDLVRHYLKPLLQAGADTIVLGCTHYPFLRGLIEQEAGADVSIIDTGAAVARQLQRQMQRYGLSEAGRGGTQFWTTGDEVLAGDVMSMLWAQPVTVGKLSA